MAARRSCPAQPSFRAPAFESADAPASESADHTRPSRRPLKFAACPGQSEDEAGLEDDEFSVLPLPSGVKQKESQEEEDENALPGYSEVVEGASLPMQTTAS